MDHDDIKRKWMNEKFWQHFERKFGYIPSLILKKSLEDKARANMLAIQKLTKDMLENHGYILNYVQKEMHENMNQNEKILYYGKKYCNTPEKFKFESGELDSIILAVEKIKSEPNFFQELKEKIKLFSKTSICLALKKNSEKEEKSTVDGASVTPDDSINNDEQIEKIKIFIMKMNKNLPLDKQLPFDRYNVKVTYNTNTYSHQATTVCPFCNRELSINKTERGYWMLSNLSRHVTKHFYKKTKASSETNFPRTTRKRSNNAEIGNKAKKNKNCSDSESYERNSTDNDESQNENSCMYIFK